MIAGMGILRGDDSLHVRSWTVQCQWMRINPRGMAQVFAEDGPARVRAFRSLEEAEGWLAGSSDA